jgi:hypothetical protein
MNLILYQILLGSYKFTKKVKHNIKPSMKKDLYNLVTKDYHIPLNPDDFYRILLDDEDGFALLINLVNKAAKDIDYSFYDYKPVLLNRLMKIHPHAWKGSDENEDDVIYAETPLGQVSFHVFDDEVKDWSGRHEEEWSGEHLQSVADKLVRKHIKNFIN